MADDKPDKSSPPAFDSDEPQKGITAGKGRPTPSRRQLEEQEEEVQGNFIQRTVASLREYFTGVRSELQKVTWPTREDTRRLSIIVVVVLIIASIVLGLISYTFTRIFEYALKDHTILLVLMMLGGVGLGMLIARSVRVRSNTY